ncbi:response regulator transcription factor [Tateyamaria omphalii]|uniref:response regulator transcription factor n=1 Tax=Tateyamaria omphalii TaxID=299262 RepID=UPI001C98EB0A|nr:response regulator transcription factor [Tateyamaria omphalii]MBY5931981.1 response regulator transcription factor [Tateyamaria omphalii]
MDKIKVLIVEDFVHTAEALRRNLLSQSVFEICGFAHSVEVALSMMRQQQPRIILTDLGLPDGSGCEVIQAAVRANWDCDCLVISIFGDEMRVVEALRAGAKGYLHKQSSPNDVSMAVLELVDGGSPMSPKIARILLSKFPKDHTDTSGPDTETGLSKRETEVMQLIAQGYKRQEVADRLSITLGTVGNHVHRIYSKLGVNSNTAAIVAATRKGIV